MNINAVNSLPSISSLNQTDGISTGNLDNSGDGFGSLIKTAVESLDKSNKSSEQEKSPRV